MMKLVIIDSKKFQPFSVTRTHGSSLAIRVIFENTLLVRLKTFYLSGMP